ncbi:MAG: EamA family transporter [Bauldia sp.]
MQPRHIVLAVVLSIIWGLNFVVIAIGLTGFPPLLLAACRFVVVSLPVLFLPRPPLPWTTLILLSGTLFVGQFALFFPAMALGMPAGLGSIVLQAQAFVTIGIAAAVLGEFPSRRQLAGAAVALAGLVVIATTVGTNGVTAAGLALSLGACVFWATANVILRRIGKVDLLALISWLSLIAIPPFFLLCFIVEGPATIGHAFAHVSWVTVGAVLYIAVLSTSFGYAAWGYLLRIYPAAVAAPFSLLVPVTGTIAATLILGEKFGPRASCRHGPHPRRPRGAHAAPASPCAHGNRRRSTSPLRG